MVRKLLSVGGHLSALALGLSLLACDSSRSSHSPAPSPVVPGGAPTVTALTIQGPSEIAPGQTVQYTATAWLSDNTTRDVTRESLWETTSIAPVNEFVLNGSGAGAVTATAGGEGYVTATFDLVWSNSKQILAVPPGTFRLIGVVRDTLAPANLLAAARVEVIGKADAGLATTTGPNGEYRLYGVSGTTTLEVSKDRYRTERHTVNVVAHQSQDLNLVLVGPLADIAGVYTLTLRATEPCRSHSSPESPPATLPEAFRVRQYIATIAQHGEAITAKLSGATFAVLERGWSDGTGNTLHGTAEADRVAFSLSYYEPYYWDAGPYPDLVEWIDDRTYLVVEGTTSMVPSATMTGMLEGAFSVLDSDPRPGTGFFVIPAPIITCWSSQHQFTLSR